MNSRAVEASRGFQWIREGFELFRKNPLGWIAITAVLVLVWIGSLLVPLLGALLFTLLSPGLFAGIMIGCRALDRGQALEVMHLFSGFREHAAPLVTVGGVYLVGTIVVFGIVLLAAGGSMPHAGLAGPGADAEKMTEAMRGVGFALLLGAAFTVPLLMLVWFAPALVALDGVAPLEAMKRSFAACWKNVLPFLVYGLAILGLWIVLSLPMPFGPLGKVLALALIALSLPVLFCSVYASYRDIFSAAGAAARNPLVR
jgi:uncharacterized membrane protein